MDLCDIREIKALLARHGFHFSKSMGQNFLIAGWVPRDIADAAGLDKGCAVLESARASVPSPGSCLSGRAEWQLWSWTPPFCPFWLKRCRTVPIQRSFTATS